MNTQRSNGPQRLHDRNEVCSILDIGYTTYHRLIGSGELRSLKIGRSRKVPSSEIERFIHAKLAEASEGQPR